MASSEKLQKLWKVRTVSNFQHFCARFWKSLYRQICATVAAAAARMVFSCSLTNKTCCVQSKVQLFRKFKLFVWAWGTLALKLHQPSKIIILFASNSYKTKIEGDTIHLPFGQGLVGELSSMAIF